MVRERCENSNIATYFTSARGIEYRRDDTAEDPGNPSRHVVRWYLYDGLGSVIAEVGEEVLMEADNTPCVPVLGVNRLDVYGNDLGGSSSTSSHKFVGKLGHTTDSNTGLIYMRARYYDPGLGRFISEDPAQDGVNWFV
ncbi:MAG TPA: RHS repeat-associated core domain-containing protein, partial [Armatimonadota bacterium]|nr:RHS repeat-associated core domain-containing protein [Armatimonadota bacterium]